MKSNHINLRSNVPFEELPKWFQIAETQNADIYYNKSINAFIWHSGLWRNGIWRNGIWRNGIWENGIWENGVWENGIWENGFRRIGQCRWKVSYNHVTQEVKIGCTTKKISKWDKWFEGCEEYRTKRGTRQFKAIYKSYLIAKYAIQVEQEREKL